MVPPPAESISRGDRWRALGLLLSLLMLAYLVLIHPWWSVPMRHLGNHIEDLRARDVRVRALLQQAPEISQTLARFQTSDTNAPGFMREDNVQLATAALVQHLETTVRAASPGNRSCAIVNRTPLAGSHPERFQRAAVQVRLSCGNTELAAVLHALESGHPRLFVDNLVVIAQRQQQMKSASGGGLDVSFELYGYLRPSAHLGAFVDAP